MKTFYRLQQIEHIYNPIVTIGTFDGVHTGHKQIIEKLIQIAEEKSGTSVIITFDTHPRMVLNQDAYKLKFINSFEEKIALLEKNGIDYLIFLPFTKEFSQMSTVEFTKNILVDKLQINTLLLGHNNRFGNKENNNFNELYELSSKYNFNIVNAEIKTIENFVVSSSKIRELIDKGNISQANKFLGYHYMITGKVIEGNRIGSRIGYPTANIDIENDFKLIPAFGVYAVLIEYKKSVYKGMLNIGIRPTLNINKLSIEVHIFDFKSDIYGENITIKFIDRIRDEKRFENLEALIKQLNEDKKSASGILKEIYL